MKFLQHIINKLIFSLALLLTLSSLSKAQITTVAGNGNDAFAGDGGLATNASLNSPHEIAVDSQGNLYIADTLNYAVRKVNIQTGVITTLIGTGQFGELHADQPAQGQSMGEIYGVAVDNNGQVFFGDASFGIIFKIDNNGILRLVVDVIHTFSTTEVFLTGMVFDQSKRFLYVADAGLNIILKIDTTNNSVNRVAGMPDFSSGFSGDGGLATTATLNFPMDVDIDTQGNLFIADSGNNRIRKVNTQGTITTVAGNGNTTFNGDNIPATMAALDFPESVAVDNSGNLLISDSNDFVIRKVDTGGLISTFAGTVNSPGFSGDGGNPLNAQFGDAFNFGLGGIAIDSNNNIYIADEGNHRIRKIAPQTGTIKLVEFTAKPGNIQLTANKVTILETGQQKEIGQRIFPDDLVPDDGGTRNIVTVIAHTDGFPQNTLIYFKSFDMDDPSTDDPKVDFNGSKGDDNKGDITRGGTPHEGKLLSVSGKTDSNGIAMVTFVVTMFPGDNFKVVASDKQAYLYGTNGSAGVHLDPNNGSQLLEESGAVVPAKQTSPLLTVWRRVHIEVDRMEKVTGNQITGTVKDAKDADKKENCTNCAVLTLDFQGNNKQFNFSRFENGRITIDNGGDFKILGSPTAKNGDILVSGNIDKGKVKKHTFTLVDDDDFNNNNQSVLIGDENESLVPPNEALELMQDSDDVTKNIYAAAFIQPEYSWAEMKGYNQSNLPFVLNVDESDTFSKHTEPNRNSKGSERNAFWITYIKFGYQIGITLDENGQVDPNSGDNDPDSLNAVIAGTPQFSVADSISSDPSNPPVVPIGGNGSLIYLEVSIDAAKEHKDVTETNTPTPHEMGHQFGLKGDNAAKGIMSTGYIAPVIRHFILEHINILRWRAKSPGQ
ncbi:MAG: hypothetical protein HYR87_07530 [Thaumarchaeota archaeon]|nr:hypothetical protein [Nitrososphaerota archaeon]